MPDGTWPRRAGLDHTAWMTAEERRDWMWLQEQARLYDQGRREVTAALNRLRQRACQRALAERRRAGRAAEAGRR